MHIIHIASEMAPAAKVGGLGDVLLGLTRETAAHGHQVEVILPKYSTIDYREIDRLSIAMRELWSYMDGGWIHNTVWEGWVAGIKVYLIEPHNPTHYFSRPTPYGCSDDIERFTYFSRAALEFLLKSKTQPDIIHLHEWQTALVAPLYWDLYHPLGLAKPGIVFTSHNLEHQGHCTTADLDRIGLHGANYLIPDKLQHDNDKHVINLLKGAIVYSNFFTTVSPTYAKEAKEPRCGMGLENVLKNYAFKFRGILNGLDYDAWAPATDPYLHANFTADELELKQANKQELKRRLLLEKGDRPLVASVSRLVPQKGVDLIKHAIFETLRLGGQFILLGSSPIPAIREDFYNLKLHFADNPHVHLELQPHEELTHMIFAGSDLFIVPSIFEPCGLTQLISQRYGSIPLVRQTGGLADTVFDVDNSPLPPEERNGFVFQEPTPSAVTATLERAFDHWKTPAWQTLIKQAMAYDFSWQQPTLAYLDIYEHVCNLLTRTSQ